jgi:uncharacterized membrane protein YtjA (UPF0391 family)
MAASIDGLNEGTGAIRLTVNASKFRQEIEMLHYAIVFLIIALIAAVFGFGGIAAGAAGIAKILFVVFLIGAVVTFLMHGRSRV